MIDGENMKNKLFHYLSYKFHRIGFYIYAVKYDFQDGGKNFVKVLIDNLKIFNNKYGYYEYLEIPITTKCSLKCKYCSNLIPCYKKPKDLDINILISSIKTFLKCINRIVYIRVLGGEPFLSNNLYEVLKALVSSNKIQRIEIVTNGTIVPSDKKLLSLLKNKRIVVCISEYNIVNYEKLVNVLEDNDIKYRIDKMNFWMDYGIPYKRNKSEKELIKQYSRCTNVCKSLINGELHLCPRSSHGTDLGIIKDNKDDYLDLLDKKMNINDKKRKLNMLLKKKYIIACDYCDYGTNNSKKVKVAEQLRK